MLLYSLAHSIYFSGVFPLNYQIILGKSMLSRQVWWDDTASSFIIAPNS